MKTSNSDAEFQRDFLTRRDAIRLLGTTAAALVAGSRRSFASDLPNIPVDEGTSPAAGGTSWGTAANLADRIRRRELSATEVCEAYIARIKRDNAALNAFVYLDEDRAREQAHAIDQRIQNGEDPGVFAGVPFAVKDMEDCKGMPTSKGSLLFKGGPPASDDAPHVARVRHAGAVMVGKTATPEFAWSSTTWSRAWGVTRNPWDLDKSPGGSSGGTAAAISSGLIPLATGTDAGGSIRSPAAFTGLVGLKSTFGRIGQKNISLDPRQVSGCLSLDVRDTARFMDVTAGPSPCDHFSLPKPQENYEKLIDTLEVQGLRAAWSADYGYIPTDPECIAVGRQSAEALVESASLKWIEIEVRLSSARTPANRLSAALLRGELELNGYWPANVKQLSEYIAHDMEGAGTLGPIDLARSEEATRKLDYEAAQLFEKIDVLFCPVTAVVSLPAQGPSPSIIGGKDARATGAEAHLTAWNLTGLPAISVPAGHSKFGFPIGLQIVCARGRDDLALRLARILEIVRPWPHFAPDYRMRIS